MTRNALIQRNTARAVALKDMASDDEILGVVGLANDKEATSMNRELGLHKLNKSQKHRYKASIILDQECKKL